jgi:hypothetical protein
MNATNTHHTPPPASIPEYLARLREALKGADRAMVQDALYDAEEYLRAELANSPGKSEAEVVAAVYASYGKPDEVAEIYRETEVTVQRALAPPPMTRPRSPDAPPRGPLARFFGVVLEPRAWGALVYLLLTIATGSFFFSWVVTGLSLSAGLMILIIGVPIAVLFFASVRVLSLVEGRLVEGLLGVRMPRRPTYLDASLPLLDRIGRMFTDWRTWSTMLYMLLMLPLGIAYFTTMVTALSLSLGLLGGGVAEILVAMGAIVLPDQVQLGVHYNGERVAGGAILGAVAVLVGALGLFASLHLARGLGWLHGQIARGLLVEASGD